MEQESVTSESSPGQLLAEGKRCLAAGDANGAVEYFQEACGLLAAAHGQVSVELAEPYYLYGKALLELARGSSSVLGSAIPVPEEKPLSDDEGYDGDDQTQSSEQANGQTLVTAENNEQNEESEPDKDNEPVSSTSEESSKNEDAPCNKEVALIDDGEAPVSNEASGDSKEALSREVDASGDDGEVPAASEEDESDLQIAWEVLELARVICQKVETDEYRLKLSDVNLVLGEIGLESDQYEQAILDIQSSLQLRQFVLRPNDRRIAEVFFSLGLAYSLNKQFSEAIDAYEKSKETLQQKKAELESQLSGGEGNKSKEKVESEIKELSDLLPDIDSKIVDVGEMKRVMENRSKEEEREGETTMGFGNNEAPTESPSNTAPPVMDISHLVRKRTRNAEVIDEAVSSDEPSAKRPCPSSPPPPPTSSVTEGSVAGSKGNLETTDLMAAVCEQAGSIKDIAMLKEKSEAIEDITSTVPEQ